MQAIFDTVALVLILTKARGGSSSGLLTLIAKQGLVYYTCVCFEPHQGADRPQVINFKVERGNVHYLGAHDGIFTGMFSRPKPP